MQANRNYSEYRWSWSYRLIREYYGIEGDITEQDASRVQEDYITARRAWIAEIRKDALKEYELGDVEESVLESFTEKLDKEVEYERLMKYEM